MKPSGIAIRQELRIIRKNPRLTSGATEMQSSQFLMDKQAFDPYHEWLGIRDKQRPPNHYRLLGLELFEEDVNVIATAADRQMVHVRTFQNSKYTQHSQRILNELAAAKLCLLKPHSRKTYDQQLRKQVQHAVSPGAGNKPPAPEKMAARAGNPESVQVIPDFGSKSTARDYRSVRNQRSGRFPWTLGAVGALAVLVVVLVWVLKARHTDQQPEIVAAVPPDKGGRGGDPVSPPDEPRNNPAPEQGNGNTESEIPADRLPEDGQLHPPPWNVPRIAKGGGQRPRPELDISAPVADALNAARSSMAGRNLQAALQQIGLASFRAQSNDELDEVERLRLLHEQLDRFWNAVRDGTDHVTPGDELEYRGTSVSTVSKGPGTITLKTPRSKPKQFPTDPVDMDADLAVALAIPELTRSGPAALVAMGAFWAMDREEDTGRARELWEEAQRQAMPVELLMAEIEYDYHELMAVARPAINQPEVRPQDPLSSIDSNPNGVKNPKKAVPGDADRAKALTVIQEVFKDNYALRDPGKRAEFSKMLITQGKETSDDPASAYVLFQEAGRMATSVGDVETAMRSADELAKRFDVDSGRIKLSMLETLNSKVRTPQARLQLMGAAEALVNDAIRDDDYQLATQLANLAMAIARKTRNATYVKRSQSLQADIRELEKRFDQAQTAADLLKEDPDNPEANLQMGWFLCCAKGQFEKGLPLLSKGSDPVLSKLAVSEIAAPVKASAQVELGDAWWELAEKEDGGIQRQLRSHAATWYEKSLPQLKGLTKTRIESRLSTTDGQTDQPTPGPGPTMAQRMAQLTGFEWKLTWNNTLVHYPVTFDAIGDTGYGEFRAKNTQKNNVVQNRWRFENSRLVTSGSPRTYFTFRNQDGVVIAESHDKKTGKVKNRGVLTQVRPRN